MAGTTTVTLNVVGTGGNAGSFNEQTSFNNPTANEQVTTQSCPSGFTAITVPTTPTQATGVIIIPPSTNTNTITLKGITGDTGVPISPNSATFIPFATTPPATIGITCSATTIITFRWI